MSETIQAGVIGFGLAGRIFHAAVLHETPGMRVASIVERTPRDAGATYPEARIVRTVDELLADPAIQLVVVATANDSHRSLAEQCMRAGRHVVVDKPVALTSEDAAALAKVARENNVVLGAYHNRRWDGDFVTLRSLLESGSLGTPITFESHFDRFRPKPKPGAWRETIEAGGGILLDLGPHLIDQALALFGAPTTLWADVRTSRLDVSVDDSFDIQMTYEESPRAELHRLRVWLRSSILAPKPGARFTLHGTEGTYEKWGLDPQEETLKNGARFADAEFGKEPESAWGTLTRPDAPPEKIPTARGDYRGLYADVRDAILGKRAPIVGIRDVWSVARVIELARESSRTGCRLKVDLSQAESL